MKNEHLIVVLRLIVFCCTGYLVFMNFISLNQCYIRYNLQFTISEGCKLKSHRIELCNVQMISYIALVYYDCSPSTGPSGCQQ